MGVALAAGVVAVVASAAKALLLAAEVARGPTRASMLVAVPTVRELRSDASPAAAAAATTVAAAAARSDAFVVAVGKATEAARVADAVARAAA